MIVVKTDTNYSNLILECDAGIAGGVLHTLSKYPLSIESLNDTCIISVSMEHINTINQDLVAFKTHLKIDESFLNWKKKHAGKIPVLIKVGVTFSKMYKSKDYAIPHTDIEDVCKYFFTPAVNQKAYKDKKWDGYIHLYKKWLGQFPTGLLDKVTGVLDFKGVPYKIEYMYDRKPQPIFDWEPKDIFALSEDQVECIDECMKAGRCVVKAATGFGKLVALLF